MDALKTTAPIWSPGAADRTGTLPWGCPFRSGSRCNAGADQWTSLAHRKIHLPESPSTEKKKERK